MPCTARSYAPTVCGDAYRKAETARITLYLIKPRVQQRLAAGQAYHCLSGSVFPCHLPKQFFYLLKGQKVHFFRPAEAAAMRAA